jgi:hypothetical protein
MGEAFAVARTDWQAVLVTLLLPVLVAASFVWLGLRPQWEDDTGDWATGMLVLLPLEFVRICVLWILRDTYADYRSPAQALRFFLLSIGILAVLCLGFALLQFGVRATLAALVQADTWRILLPPAALIVADGAIGLYFFRGDARVQAARLEAQGDDAQDWLCLAVCALPVTVLLPCFVILVRNDHGAWLPPWLPRGSDAFRAVGLLYVAAYFVGKGLLLAHAYSARFRRSGARVLGARWIRFVLERDTEKRAAAIAAEARKAAKRRSVLATGAVSADPS